MLLLKNPAYGKPNEKPRTDQVITGPMRVLEKNPMGRGQTNRHTDIPTTRPTLAQRAELVKISLLRRLQAQTLPDATTPIGKIHPFNKIATNFEPVMRLGCPLRFINILYFMTESTIFNH